MKWSALALLRTAQTHSLHRPWGRKTGLSGSSFGTWMEEARLQGSLEGQEQLLPLVSPLQAVLEVLNGWPGVREVCRKSASPCSAHVPACTCCACKKGHTSAGPRAEQPHLHSVTPRNTC